MKNENWKIENYPEDLPVYEIFEPTPEDMEVLDNWIKTITDNKKDLKE